MSQSPTPFRLATREETRLLEAAGWVQAPNSAGWWVRSGSAGPLRSVEEAMGEATAALLTRSVSLSSEAETRLLRWLKRHGWEPREGRLFARRDAPAGTDVVDAVEALDEICRTCPLRVAPERISWWRTSEAAMAASTAAALVVSQEATVRGVLEPLGPLGPLVAGALIIGSQLLLRSRHRPPAQPPPGGSPP